MKIRRGRILMAIIGALCGTMVLVSGSPAQTKGGEYAKLAAEWWKWVSSVPCTKALCPNPAFDTTGDYGAVGQHGDVWFLAGTFGGPATRNVDVPEGVPIFVPVVNNWFVDTPNACGQGPESFTADEMRALIAPSIDAAINLSATLDGTPFKMFREQSVVFEVAVPKDNIYEILFETPCAQGVYSPGVDDGYYVLIKKLKAGLHKLHIHAEIPRRIPPDFVVDVTYNLNVVPVKLK